MIATSNPKPTSVSEDGPRAWRAGKRRELGLERVEHVGAPVERRPPPNRRSIAARAREPSRDREAEAIRVQEHRSSPGLNSAPTGC